MPERPEGRTEAAERMLLVMRCLLSLKTGGRCLLRQERGRTHFAMSGDCSVVADTLKLDRVCLPIWRGILGKKKSNLVVSGMNVMECRRVKFIGGCWILVVPTAKADRRQIALGAVLSCSVPEPRFGVERCDKSIYEQ